MADAPTPECPNCKRLEARVAQLEALVSKLQARIEALEAGNARLRKNSSNSHKPPSSDIVKPPPPARRHGKRRRIGGQPGHPRHRRPPFPPDQIDQTRLYTLGQCPDCGGPLRPASRPPRVVQQVELIERPVLVTEHRAPAYWCTHCLKAHRARLPAEVRAASLVGTRLTALVGATRKYGARLLGRLRGLFGVIHRRDRMGAERSERALERERKGIVRAARHPPWTREARKMAERFRRHADAYFRFITTPGVEPTNNLAEQALRFVVIQRLPLA